MKPLIVIPSRLRATRLPNKPLADIHGAPMIVHVWRRAVASGVGPVVVACGDKPIFDAIQQSGGLAVMTDPDLPSGSDRVLAAVHQIDPEGAHDVIVNLQGDLPTLDPSLVEAALKPLVAAEVDIATLAVEIQDDPEAHDPNVVKIALALHDADPSLGRALYFSRAPIPWGDGPRWHHVGVYAYRREALERFVAAPPAALETMEKLEQLRALAMGLRIDAAVVHTVPLGVDAPADLERARQLIGKAN